MKITNPIKKSSSTNDRDFVFTVSGGPVNSVRVFMQGREVPPIGYNDNSVTVYFPSRGKYWVRLVINGKELPSKVITVK